MSEFKRSLDAGLLAEGAIAEWLRARGNTVIPAYQIEHNDHKGPQVYTPTEELISPDLLVWKNGETCWVEAKSKSAFTWHRKSGTWNTGIDLHHYEQYRKVLEHFDGWDVWLFFLHASSQPSDIDLLHPSCPSRCPVGLFGNSLQGLTETEHHRDSRWGTGGMVYWERESLKLLAHIDEMRRRPKAL